MIKLFNYKVIKKSKGKIFKYLTKKDKIFKGFGEVYISVLAKKEIRAWKKNKKAFMNLFVIKGKVKFVFFDDKSSKFKYFILNQNKSFGLAVPPKNWYGFKNLSKNKSEIMNILNITHNTKDINNKKINEINFKW